jgi:hypothetical protein
MESTPEYECAFAYRISIEYSQQYNDQVHPRLKGSEERADCKASGATFCCAGVETLDSLILEALLSDVFKKLHRFFVNA